MKKTQRSFNSTIRKSGAPKKTNPARRGKAAIVRRRRTKKEFARIYGPPGYVEWIHEQPCVGCGVVGYSEVAHIQTGGMGRKDDWVRTIPLCGIQSTATSFEVSRRIGCHPLLHKIGKLTFQVAYGINLDNLAAETQAAWLSSLGSSPGGET